MARTVRAYRVRTLIDMSSRARRHPQPWRFLYMQQMKKIPFARMVRTALATLGDGRRGSSAYAIERRASLRCLCCVCHPSESAALFRYIEHVHWDRRPIDRGALKRARTRSARRLLR